MTVYMISIPTFHKYNSRRDISNPSWFRWENKFLESVNGITLANDQIILWVYLVSQRSKFGQDIFKISSKHTAFVCKITEDSLPENLSALQNLEMIRVNPRKSVTSASRGRNVDVTSAGVDVTSAGGDVTSAGGDVTGTSRRRALHNKTRHNSTEQDINLFPAEQVVGSEKAEKVKNKAKPKSDPVPKKVSQSEQAKATSTTLVWEPYREHFFAKYKTEPQRGKDFNMYAKRLVDNVEHAKIPGLIKFFLEDDRKFLVDNFHAIGWLVKGEWLHKYLMEFEGARSKPKDETPLRDKYAEVDLTKYGIAR